MRLNSNEAAIEGQLLQRKHQWEALLKGTQPLPQGDFSGILQPIVSTHPGTQERKIKHKTNIYIQQRTCSTNLKTIPQRKDKETGIRMLRETGE